MGITASDLNGTDSGPTFGNGLRQMFYLLTRSEADCLIRVNVLHRPAPHGDARCVRHQQGLGVALAVALAYEGVAVIGTARNIHLVRARNE